MLDCPSSFFVFYEKYEGNTLALFFSLLSRPDRVEKLRWWFTLNILFATGDI
jgi:hypothetical protein